MGLTSLYTCSRCRKEFNFSNIKYDTDKSLICLECLEKKNRVVKKQQDGKEIPDKKINFICANCRYKFTLKLGSPKSFKCPYCGKSKILAVKKYKDENDLINDSMDPRFDF